MANATGQNGELAHPEIEVFQSITAVPPGTQFSHEEIRLLAYQKSRTNAPRYGSQLIASKSTTTALTELSMLPSGIKYARLPEKLLRAMVQYRLAGYPFELSSEVVRFEVGSDEPQSFAIHENSVFRASDLVQKALSNRCKEVTGHSPHDLAPRSNPEAFELYQRWLHSRRIFIFEQRDFPAQIHATLVQCYMLGDKLFDKHFQDESIDSIVDVLKITRKVDVRLVNTIYDNTAPGCALRRLWQDIYVVCGDATWLDSDHSEEEIKRECLLDLARTQMTFWQGHRPETLPFIG
ncbi:hypothetical protein LTR62_001079 [Meristemomyces frigidus]|uniref:BTB domain-containing protein n=1 Tax=Meristemomyces frigidus TaxID=1508187 RepID=A0AAN7T8L5_9PEZI|nr:hypothetical protein LTR62_001079 [Meristemomyces frigidus]